MPLNFFTKLTAPDSFLGIDIGTTSIKIVEVKRGKPKPQLVNYALFETFGHLERANTALQTSTLKLFDQEIAEYLKIALKNGQFSSRQAIASLPAFSAFTTIIEIPKMAEKEAAQTLSFKAKQYIPMPLTSVALDWIKVGEKTDSDGNQIQQIFLISIPNEQIQTYKNIFSQANLKLNSLEVESISLARILSLNSSQPVLIVDIGSRSTSLIVAKNGSPQFTSQTDFAGSSLTQSVSSGLGINMRRSEDLKRQKGLSGLAYGPEKELSTLMLPMLDVIINEVKRTKDNFENAYQQKVENIVLAGGGANLQGIEKYFQDQLNLPVSKANPLEKLSYPADLQPLANSLGPTLAVALGLAIKPYAQ